MANLKRAGKIASSDGYTIFFVPFDLLVRCLACAQNEFASISCLSPLQEDKRSKTRRHASHYSETAAVGGRKEEH
jgi:hypothetical protein